MKDSKAQLEVWQCKKEAWKEVAHLELEEAIRKRLADSIKTAKTLNIGRTHEKH